MSNIEKNKKGQVTIFIIAGILIVAIVLLFFFLKSRGEEPPQGTASPESILETCLKQDVYDAVDLISMQGGSIDPNDPYINFKFTNEPAPAKIGYLCYTSGEGNCKPQSGSIFEYNEDELKKYLNISIRNCFNSLGREIEKQGFTVDATYKGYDLDIEYKKIIIKIKGEITTTKADKVITKKDIKVEFPSSLYEILIFPVHNIIKAEAFLWDCHFDYIKYERDYPEFNIELFTTGEGVNIYTITHGQTNERYRFATRSCVRGAGYP